MCVNFENIIISNVVIKNGQCGVSTYQQIEEYSTKILYKKTWKLCEQSLYTLTDNCYWFYKIIWEQFIVYMYSEQDCCQRIDAFVIFISTSECMIIRVGQFVGSGNKLHKFTSSKIPLRVPQSNFWWRTRPC